MLSRCAVALKLLAARLGDSQSSRCWSRLLGHKQATSGTAPFCHCRPRISCSFALKQNHPRRSMGKLACYPKELIIQTDKSKSLISPKTPWLNAGERREKNLSPMCLRKEVQVAATITTDCLLVVLARCCLGEKRSARESGLPGCSAVIPLFLRLLATSNRHDWM